MSRVGKGLREPARDALLSTSVQPAYYGRAFGFSRAMDALGAVVGPLIALIALPYATLRPLIFFSIVPGACAVLAIVLLVQESTKPTITHPPSLRATLPSFFIFFLIIMFIFRCGNFHPTLLILRAQQALQSTGALATVAERASIMLYIFFNSIEAISEYALGRLSDRGGRKQLLALVGFGLFGISSLLIGSTSSLAGMLMAFILSGISVAGISVLSRSYVADLLPAPIRGFGYGSLQGVEGFAKLIASFMVGTLWTQISPAAGFGYAAGTSFIAMILLLLYKP
jgi:MFS family permease